MTTPTTEKTEPWLYCNMDEDVDYHPGQTGKWMIFPSSKNVDSYWERIAASGLPAKVSTGAGNAKLLRNHIICVYAQLNKKEEVRSKLREIGFTGDLAWKTDEDTLKGNYSAKHLARLARSR